MIRTSETHPIRIDQLVFDTGARVGMTFCPGKYQPNGLSGAWDRDLWADLTRIKDAGVERVVTLIEDHEFERLHVEDLPDVTRTLGMEWMHLPIVDLGVPDAAFEGAWRSHAGPTLHQSLDRGGFFVLHCMGGLGRTGTIAARLLIERGVDAASAIKQVRTARTHTIETVRQEGWLYAYESSPDKVRWPV